MRFRSTEDNSKAEELHVQADDQPEVSASLMVRLKNKIQIMIFAF